jgi:hypothetical protein
MLRMKPQETRDMENNEEPTVDLFDELWEALEDEDELSGGRRMNAD